MDLIFYIERDGKIERIEGERLVFCDFFYWMELVNLILGFNIKNIVWVA